jgi:ankyrin repeat protein
VSHRDAEGHTPLHWAAYQNHETVARLLLSLGADIRSVDNEGLTPMHWASLKVRAHIRVSCARVKGVRDERSCAHQRHLSLYRATFKWSSF